MQRLLQLACGIVITGASVGCELRNAAAPTKSGLIEAETITARVLDRRTGKPLAGARVTIQGVAATITDSSGLYRLPRASLRGARAVESVAAAPGYETATRIVDFGADSVRIPALFLRPSPRFVVIGPEGGIIEGEGATLRVPKGALESPTPISLSVTGSWRVSVPGTTAMRSATGFELRPRGLRFSTPVEFTLRLPHELPVNSALEVLIVDPQTQAGRKAGIDAVPVGDGSVRFELAAFPETELAVVANAIYILTGIEDIITKSTTRAFVSECGIPATAPVLTLSPAYDRSVLPYEFVGFNTDHVESYISSIPYQEAGAITVLSGSSTRIRVTRYWEMYVEHERAENWAYLNEKEILIGEETILFAYFRLRSVYEKVACHMQGVA